NASVRKRLLQLPGGGTANNATADDDEIVILPIHGVFHHQACRVSGSVCACVKYPRWRINSRRSPRCATNLSRPCNQKWLLISKNDPGGTRTESLLVLLSNASERSASQVPSA